MSEPIAILSTGIVSSVGMSTAMTCAALRANVANPSESPFVGVDGEWLMNHCVPLDQPWSGLARLANMAALVIEECLMEVARTEWRRIPLLLCIAESTRPGRIEAIEETLKPATCELLGEHFSAQSLVIPHGRVGVGVALLHARKLLADTDVPGVLIVGSDSLIRWPTLKVLEKQNRLLNGTNSNGFLPGEAAAALYVGRSSGQSGAQIRGLGFSMEAANIESEEPLRAAGLTHAVRIALDDAGCELHDMDLRITDISGEQYYFKEAALVLSRLLRKRKTEFDLWHPAECIGETGSAIGPLMLAVAAVAFDKGYAAGPGILVHGSNDAGQRMAIVLRKGGT